MIDDVDMQVKSDGELLELWEGQNEIVDGLVNRVGAEIKRRGLDTSTVQVRASKKTSYSTKLVEHESAPLKIKGKFPRFLVAAAVGLASGTAFFFGLLFFTWVHEASAFFIYLFIALLYLGPPVIAVLVCRSTYRKLSV